MGISFITLIGLVAVITSALRLFPQIIKGHRRKSVRDVSFTWELIGALSSALWLWYGLLIVDSIIAYGGGVVLAGYLALMYQHVIYE